jgi:iron complex outermembrane receptor protein
MNGQIISCVAGIFVTTMGATGAYAQAQTAAPVAGPAAAADNDAQLKEIVVTARKRSENMQKVPVAITAFSGAELESRSVHRFTDIAQSTPGLVIAASPADPNSPVVQLRGQKQDTIQIATEPSVGIYLDGVYTGGSLGSNVGDLVDIDRVEVLKGPQGTLYGRNTTGGAVNIFTKMPTNKFEGQVAIGAGDYGRISTNAVLNVPLGGDDAGLRLVGSFTRHDGYANQKILPGVNQPDVGQKDPNSQNTLGFRGTLRLKPSAAFDIVIRGDYSRSLDNGSANHPIYFLPSNAGMLTAAAIQITGKSAASITAQDRTNALALLNTAASSDLLDVYNAFNSTSRGKSGGASATLSYDLGSAVIKSITAYRHAVSNRSIDGCGCGINLASFIQNSTLDLFTQELQLGGGAFDNRLKYTVGAYYSKKTGSNREDTIVFSPLNLATNPTVNAYDLNDRSFAAFTQASFALTPTINVTGGLRYTDSKRTLVVNDFNAVSCQLPAAALIVAPAVLLPNCRLSNFKKDTNLSYTAGLDWSPTPDTLIYVKTSRGFQAGGVNLRPNTNPLSVATYKPEIVTDYEIGLKSQWFDRRLRFNIDYYHSNLKDAQRNALVALPPPAVGPGTNVLTNAASAKIDGVEAELSATPFPHAFIGLSGAYTDARYAKYLVGGIDQSFLNFFVTPKWSYSATASYTVPTGIGPFKAQTDWSWRSKQDLYPQDTPGAVNGSTATGTPTLGAGTPDIYRIQRSYGLFNASLSLTVQSLDMDIRVYTKNLFDKRYATFAFGLVNSGLGIATAVAGEPRTFGIDLVKRF